MSGRLVSRKLILKKPYMARNECCARLWIIQLIVSMLQGPEMDTRHVVRPKLPKDASNAYWVAEKACPVNNVKKETKATVEKAVVKLSTIIVAKNKVSLGPA